MTCQLFESAPTLFGPCDLYQFNLLELVLANQTAHIASVRSGFGAEAGRVRRVLEWQVFVSQDLTAMKICERNFSGRDWIQRFAFDLEKVLFKLWELRCSRKAVGGGE